MGLWSRIDIRVLERRYQIIGGIEPRDSVIIRPIGGESGCGIVAGRGRRPSAAPSEPATSRPAAPPSPLPYGAGMSWDGDPGASDFRGDDGDDGWRRPEARPPGGAFRRSGRSLPSPPPDGAAGTSWDRDKGASDFAEMMTVGCPRRAPVAGDEKTYIKIRPRTPSMERFVILVSGRVQKVGYRSKVLVLARDMGITGWVRNLPDGRVKIVAEGDAAALERFASALTVKNAVIDVSDVEVERHDASGEYGAFSKLVDEGETDARLDRSAELLKELIDVTRGGFSDLGQKMDQMLDKQDETTGEVRGLRSDMKGNIDMRLERIEAALKEKGII